jgi:hypothetical protein
LRSSSTERGFSEEIIAPPLIASQQRPWVKEFGGTAVASEWRYMGRFGKKGGIAAVESTYI